MTTLVPVEWAYKATDARLDFSGTLLLAKRGILCRSPHNPNGARAANVAEVKLGDVIHFYYMGRSGARAVGRFEVTRPDGHRLQASLGDQIDGTALFELSDTAVISDVDKDGAFQRDPLLGVYSVWVLRHLGAPAPYPREVFPNMSSLRRLPTAAGSVPGR